MTKYLLIACAAVCAVIFVVCADMQLDGRLDHSPELRDRVDQLAGFVGAVFLTCIAILASL